MSTAVRRAIYGQLTSAGVTLSSKLGTPAPNYVWGIYHNAAPDKATPPFIILSKSSGIPTEAFHDPSALETDVWMIKAVDRNTTADTAETIANLIKTQLNDQTLSISGSVCLYLRRESDVEYSELTDGDLYQHVGALYRLITD